MRVDPIAIRAGIFIALVVAALYGYRWVRAAQRVLYMPAADERLFSAVGTDNYSNVRQAIRKGGNPHAERKGKSVLFLAVHQDQAQATKALIDGGADVNKPCRYGPPLFAAVWGSNKPMVELLLARGADPNLPAIGTTPLIEAIRFGSDAIIETLLEHGADPRAKNSEGKTARQVAVELGKLTAARKLKRAD